MGSVLQILGLIAVVTGAAMLMPVAGVLTGGVALILIGLALEKSHAA